MPTIEANTRFFIITAARSGSTLLSAILADAGADFGMATPQEWDRAGGELEHPDLARAFYYFSKAETISKERPPFGISRLRWVFYRSQGKKKLHEVLAACRFAKHYNAHRLVRPAFKIGYFPTVILSYRRFDDQAVSFGLMHPHADWDLLRNNYREVYNNGLWLLNTFGGCAVAYEEVVDFESRSWAQPLADVTGLPIAELISARNRRVAHSPHKLAPGIDEQTNRIHQAMRSLSGKAVAASPQALRSWHRAASRPEAETGQRPARQLLKRLARS